MGIFNGIFGRGGSNREIREAQREEQRINEEFRRESRKKAEEMEQQLADLSQRIRRYETELNSLKRERNYEIKRDTRETREREEVREEQIQEMQKEREESERNLRLSEEEYKEAKKVIEKMKSQIKEYTKNEDIAAIEKLEKKLNENILIFKNRFLNNQYKDEALKKLKIAGEIIYEIGNFYYNLAKYDKALNYFIKYQDFNIESSVQETVIEKMLKEEKSDLKTKIIKCSYQCGKYDDIKELLKDYGKNNNINELLLKIEIYLKLQEYEEAEEIIKIIEKEFLKEYSGDFEPEHAFKLQWDKYIQLLENFVLNSGIKNQNILRYLFFALLYRKKIEKMEQILNKTENFKEKDFFEGIVLLKAGKSSDAERRFTAYLDKLYGLLYYIESIKKDLKDDKIKVFDKFLNLDLENDDIVKNKKDEFIVLKNHLQAKKYEILGYKLDYFLKNKKDELKESLEQIKEVFISDGRPSFFKGNSILWLNFIKTIDYLEKIDSPLSEDFKKFLKRYVSAEDIENLNKIINEEELDINIDDEYEMQEKKNELSLYSETKCINKITKESKIYIEITENMNISEIQNKKYKLKKDQSLAEKDIHFVKIDNFFVKDNEIKIITENYEMLYEEKKEEFQAMSYREKMREAYKLLETFESLEKNNIFLRNLNIDNLIYSGEEYKYRFSNYSVFDNKSLSSTKSLLRKKLNLYKTAEEEKREVSKEANIFILGLLFYDVFYGEHILSEILSKEMNAEEKNSIREAFLKKEPIEKNRVLNVSKRRIYLEDKEKNTVCLKKAKEEIFVPKKITELIENMLDTIEACRPSLEEVRERLENIEGELSDYTDYFPEIIEKDELEMFVDKISESIEKIIIRNKELADILPVSIYDPDISALIIIENRNGKIYEISDIGKYYAIAIIDEEKERLNKKSAECDILSELERIKSKLEDIQDSSDYKEFSEKNNISEEESMNFIYSIIETLNKYKKENILKIEKEDRKILKKISTKEKENLYQLLETNKCEYLLRILSKMI